MDLVLNLLSNPAIYLVGLMALIATLLTISDMNMNKKNIRKRRKNLEL